MNIVIPHEEGQWKPDNASGKKRYGEKFMFIFKRACKTFSEHANFADSPKLDKSLVPEAKRVCSGCTGPINQFQDT